MVLGPENPADIVHRCVLGCLLNHLREVMRVQLKLLDESLSILDRLRLL